LKHAERWRSSRGAGCSQVELPANILGGQIELGYQIGRGDGEGDGDGTAARELHVSNACVRTKRAAEDANDDHDDNNADDASGTGRRTLEARGKYFGVATVDEASHAHAVI